MKFKVMSLVLVFSFLSLAATCLADSKEEKQAKIRKAVDQTLQDLYKLQPSAQSAIQKSAGYAVFKKESSSNPGVKPPSEPALRFAAVGEISGTSAGTDRPIRY